MLSRLFRAALDLLYPPCCVICREPGETLCAACREKAPLVGEIRCQVCSAPFEGLIDGPFTCADCEERQFHFTCAVATRRNSHTVREFIHEFKYNRKLALAKPLANWLAETLDDPRLLEPACDRLVPVPLHHVRRRERGFNQALVLARLLSKQSGIPVADCLKRTRYTTSQTGFNRAARMENLRGAFQMRQHHDVRNLHLLLIDDVLTTGSTVEECSKILLRAGAASVRVATVARA